MGSVPVLAVMTPAQYQAKAAAAAGAWAHLFGAPPTRNALLLALAVADLETGLGSVPGHNWGSVHKRGLSAPEAAAIAAAGLSPVAADLAAARALVPPTSASELLFVDTGPSGPYFVWLWAFPDDTSAAVKFLQVLVQQRPSVRAIIDTATPAALAGAMYASQYFTGTSTDPQTNVDAYAALVRHHAATITTALAGWPSSSPAAPASAPAAAGGAIVALLLLATAFRRGRGIA